MYKEHLITRIPEAFQDNDGVKAYLETAGELFDEYLSTITGMDNYRDSHGTDRRRLRQLALDFGMNFPRNLDERTQRQIMRDIHDIYSRVGIKEFTDWVFRILGWEIEIEHAWLPNPDLYDPSIGEIHKLDDYGSRTSATITDFYEADYRAFYLGDSYIDTDGSVYFRGRRFFDDEITIDQLEIVGEDYNVLTKKRTADKVGATPYIFVNVEEENYTTFPTSYVDQESGVIYDYGMKERFEIIENVLNYYVFDEFRPSHVRVVIIVKTERNDDQVTIYSDVSTEYESKPLLLYDDAVITMEDTSRLDHIIRSGNLFMVGTPPSPFGRKMVIAPLDVRKWISTESSPDNLLRYSFGGDKTDPAFRRFRISMPMEYQPLPLSGTKEFTFYTPDREEFDFRLVFGTEDDFLSAHIEAGSLEGVYTFPYSEDDESLRLNFDLTTDTYGIIDGLEPPSIIVREPTTINSYNLKPTTAPANEYRLAETSNNGDTFNDDFLLTTSFKDKQAQHLDSSVTFTYFYDMEVIAKRNNRDTDFVFLTNDPVADSFQVMTEWNTILFVPQIRLGFDFVIDVKYLQQPIWENDPRND